MTSPLFAVRGDGLGWRSVTGADELAPGEILTDVQPPDVEIVYPIVVTMRQARIALHRAGLLASVNLAIQSLPEPQKSEAVIAWEFSSAVPSDSPLIALVAASAGLSDADVSALFVEASTL